MPLVTLVIAWLLKFFTFETAKYFATRAMIILLVMTLGPIAIFKGFGLIMRFMTTYGTSILSALLGQVNVQVQQVQLYGVGAYLGSHMRIGEGISIYLSWLSLKFIWGLLPKWGFPTSLVK